MGKTGTVKEIKQTNLFAKGRVLHLELVPVEEFPRGVQLINYPLHLLALLQEAPLCKCPPCPCNKTWSVFPFPAPSLSLFQEQMLLCCRVSVVASHRDLGPRYLSQLCRCVPLVSLSVVWPLVFLAVGAGPAGSCLPAVCGTGVVRPGWLVVPVSMLQCRFCLSLSLLSPSQGVSYHFPEMPYRT